MSPATPSAHLFPRHQLRRIARAGDRLRDRRLPARHGAVGSRHPARPRPAPPRHHAATSPSARKTTRSRSSRASTKAQTTGTPICLLIRNTDQRSKDYGNIARDLPPRPRRLHLPAEVRPARPARRRPRLGAADRADGRPPARSPRMAARSSTARCFAAACADRRDRDPVRVAGTMCRTTRSSRQRADVAAARGLHGRAAQGRRLAAARASASTARGVPVGLGEPLFDKLDADIAYAMMGINAVKGVEIGAGFASVAQRGTDARRRADAARASRATTPAACSAASAPARTSTVSIAIKPTSSIRTPRATRSTSQGEPTKVET